MFDKAIIDTERFMELPMSAKAVYFLLGMEADDEGFVSYKKVLRIHGGNEDDAKILLAKQFIIKFESGVVVITDWNKNNWLDSRRIRQTEYKKEKKQLILTSTKEYVLSSGLASIEEYRGDEIRIEENKLSKNKTQIAESQIDKKKQLTPNQVIELNLIRKQVKDALTK